MRVWLNLRRNAFSEVFENYFFDSITFSFRSLHPRLPFISLSHPLALCLLFPISLFHTIFLSAMSLFSHTLCLLHITLFLKLYPTPTLSLSVSFILISLFSLFILSNYAINIDLYICIMTLLIYGIMEYQEELRKS